MEANNMAAMREAIVRLREIANTAFERMREGVETVNLPQAIWHWCEKAMSAPPRNCDVGTAKEQYERFRDYCYSKKCPFIAKDNTLSQIAFTWAQMPYEEGVANG